MGKTNHGSQDITINYYEEATSYDVNRRNIDIVPRGIYSGGHLTRVSDTEVTISPFVAEIGDDDIQVSVITAATATLKSTTLDSGDIDASTPYLVLRWSYLASQVNYVEIHAIASVSAAQDNDIIIGKCVFSAGVLTGFDYTYRTFLNVQNLFLKVVTNSGLYVWIRAGKIYTDSGYIVVPEQQVGPFSAPSSPNSRIDLVYVDTDGTVSIQQGTAALSPSAPSYNRKLVVAQVLLVNGDTSIPASRITDTRSFITSPTRLTQGQVVTASSQLTSTTSAVDVSGMNITMTTTGGIVLVNFSTVIATEDGQKATLRLQVDGVTKVTTQSRMDTTGQSYSRDSCHMHWLCTNLSAGSHTFKIRWSATGTSYMNPGSASTRVLSVLELP